MTAEEDYDTECEHLRKAAVETFTTAARLDHPTFGTLDFAAFLADVLRATAANLGDPSALTAGRPGSWESAALNQLLIGTIGSDPDLFELAAYRTEPIHVQLHVANLIFHNADDPDAPEEFDDAADHAGDDDDARALIAQQYTSAYQSYADRFAAAVRAEAAKRPALAELVTVDVNTSLTWQSEPEIDNPIEGDCDPLVWHFWSTAQEAVGLPAISEGR